LLWVSVVWLFVLTCTGVSAPCGQVNSVCVAIETNDFWLRCVVEVVEPETTEAAVRLEEVFVDCSERAAFLASGNEIPCSTFICCILFSEFHLGHSREEAEWSALQLTHFFDFCSGLPHGQIHHSAHTKQCSCKLSSYGRTFGS